MNRPVETRKFYQKLNNKRKEFKPRVKLIRDKEEQILIEKTNILERMAEHFEEKINTITNNPDNIRENQLRSSEQKLPVWSNVKFPNYQAT